jgi:transcriptional regulator NrdR family protein
MKCPKCGSDSEVISTRTLPGNTVTRRRQCVRPRCRTRFTTHEAVASATSEPPRQGTQRINLSEC